MILTSRAARARAASPPAERRMLLGVDDAHLLDAASAIPSLMRRDPLRRLPITWLHLVIAEAMHGDLDAAREAEAAGCGCTRQAWLTP